MVAAAEVEAAAASVAEVAWVAVVAAAASPPGCSSLTAEDGILPHSRAWTDTHLP